MKLLHGFAIVCHGVYCILRAAKPGLTTNNI